MTAPRYFAELSRRGWRIFRAENGTVSDLCGAVSHAVAWAQCDIFNALTRAA